MVRESGRSRELGLDTDHSCGRSVGAGLVGGEHAIPSECVLVPQLCGLAAFALGSNGCIELYARST